MHASDQSQPVPRTGFRGMAHRLGEFISFICIQASGLALLIIVVICAINVIGRYVFLHAFSWAEEAMSYCMIFIIFFASAAVTWRGQHLHLDMLLQKFPTALQKILAYVTAVASAALLLLLSYMSWDVVARLYRFAQRSETLEIPMWIPQSFVPIGLVLIAVMLLLRLFTQDPLPRPIDFATEETSL